MAAGGALSPARSLRGTLAAAQGFSNDRTATRPRSRKRKGFWFATCAMTTARCFYCGIACGIHETGLCTLQCADRLRNRQITFPTKPHRFDAKPRWETQALTDVENRDSAQLTRQFPLRFSLHWAQ